MQSLLWSWREQISEVYISVITSFIRFFFDSHSSVKVNRFCNMTWNTSAYICLLYILCFVTLAKSNRRKIDDIHDVVIFSYLISTYFCYTDILFSSYIFWLIAIFFNEQYYFRSIFSKFQKTKSKKVTRTWRYYTICIID